MITNQAPKKTKHRKTITTAIILGSILSGITGCTPEPLNREDCRAHHGQWTSTQDDPPKHCENYS